MNFRVHLRRRPGPAALRALLPTLLEAQSVRIDASSLRCSVAGPRSGFLQTSITAAVERLGLAPRVSAQPAAAAEPGPPWADSVLTLIAPPGVALPADLLAPLAQCNLELRGLRRLSPRGSAQLAFELHLDDAARARALHPAIARLAQRWGVDLALTGAESKRPRRRLVAFDMDSTLIRCEVIDQLAARAGVGEAVAAITARAMRGEVDFCASFRERLAKLRGLPVAALAQVAERLPLMPGAEGLLSTLRAQGHYTVILSGGFDYFARCLQQQLGFHEIHANALQIERCALTGAIDNDIVDGARKRALLEQIAAQQGLSMADTVAVGDGANDLPMIEAAGLGVAFHAKPRVRERAPTALTHCDLAGLLYLLGVSAADSQDPGADLSSSLRR